MIHVKEPLQEGGAQSGMSRNLYKRKEGECHGEPNRSAPSKMGLKQEEFARMIRVSRQTVSAIETGKYNPSLELAFTISDFSDCRLKRFSYTKGVILMKKSDLWTGVLMILAGVAFLLAALLLGGAMGVVYDLFRILRVRVHVRLLGPILDLLFWLGVTAGLFALTLLRDDGQVRIFHMAAVSLGGGAYFLTLSRLILPVLLWLAGRIRALFRLLTAPARRAGRGTKNF